MVQKGTRGDGRRSPARLRIVSGGGTAQVPGLHFREAFPEDFQVVENLRQFYHYEFSDWLPLDVAATGRYELGDKRGYLAQPTTTAFLAFQDMRLAGFATIDEDVVQPESAFNLSYFFVTKRYQRQGIGSQFMAFLFQNYPGYWEIYHLRDNQRAAIFWPRVFKQLSLPVSSVKERVINGDMCQHYQIAALRAPR